MDGIANPLTAQRQAPKAASARGGRASPEKIGELQRHEWLPNGVGFGKIMA
jgi:hypothetical protein